MDPLSVIAQNLTREFFPQTLAIGMVCLHPDGRKVQITDGQYMGTYGLSNFWYWREVKKGGKLARKVEHGYGWRPAKVFKKGTL